MSWANGWFWIIAALVLAGLELVLPGWFFLGMYGRCLRCQGDYIYTRLSATSQNSTVKSVWRGIEDCGRQLR